MIVYSNVQKLNDVEFEKLIQNLMQLNSMQSIKLRGPSSRKE